ncbi:MAG: TldD/PmbA family protein [Spirochaetes bacterium]|nr:TldD/PmbA family protein [Spirochaetota bacterium]
MAGEFGEITRLASSLLETLPCQYAEIRISKGLSTAISLSSDEIEAMTSGESAGGSVRVLSGGAWGFVSFNDMDAMERCAGRACELARAVTAREKSSIRSAPAATGSFTTPAVRDHREVPLEEKLLLIRGYNDILRSSPRVQSTRAIYRDLTSRHAFLNSEGTNLEYRKSFAGVSLASIARDGAVIQPFHESVAGYGGFEIVQGREALAESVVRTAVDLLGAAAPEGGRYRLMADQKLAGVFIHEAFGHLSEADFVHENPRMREVMVLGREFGPPELQVIDSGALPELAGYIPFDDEGTPPGETRLISRGVLSGRLHSRETAAAMDEAVTGNARAISVFTQPIVRMTNTYIDNGPWSREELFAEMEDGIYAIDVIGGQTNLEMFTFTCGYGYEIKKGKIGRMFKDIVLSGNVFSTLKNIAGIGNDRRMFGGLGGCGKGGQSPLPVSFGGPHILINDVLVGGPQ